MTLTRDELEMEHVTSVETPAAPLHTSLLDPLPGGRISQDQFENWKNSFIKQLSQNEEFSLFLPDGLYSTWTPASKSQNGLSIVDVHQHDPLKLKTKSRQLSDGINVRVVPDNDTQDLLLQRNSQLQDFLELIYDANGQCLYDEIFVTSSSLGSIMESVLTFRMGERRPDKILDLSDLQPGQDLQAFYLKFRSDVCGNLKRKGDIIEFLNGQLTEDELLSPTFEEVIVLWCLEKIDADLPRLVKETFKDQLQGNTTLKDLQHEIFNSVPLLLQTLDSQSQGAETNSGLEGMELTADDCGESDTQTWAQQPGGEGRLSVPQADFNVEENGSKKFRFNKKCKFCGEKFLTRRKLILHQRTHRGSKPLACDECDKKFNYTKYLNDHKLRYHTKFSCKNCSSVLRGSIEYEDHLKIEHGDDLNDVDYRHLDPSDTKQRIAIHKEGLFICNICSKSFSSSKKLTTHMRGHERLPSACTCEHCLKTFTSKASLYFHKRRMHKVLIECGKCGESFTSKKSFEVHMRTHNHKDVKQPSRDSHLGGKSLDGKDESESKKYTGMEVSHSNAFSDVNIENTEDSVDQKTSMDESLDVEAPSRVILLSRERTHNCDVCDKSFYDAHTLKLHRDRHFTDTLACKLCNIKFEHKKLFSIHMNTLHRQEENEKTIPCEVCGKLFRTQNLLRAHTKIHSEGWNKLRCEICSRSFTDEKQRKSHICKHYSCDLCDIKFVRNRNLKEHKKEHQGVTMYHCDMCESLFDKKRSLAEHKKYSHLGVKRYSCTFCPKEFAMKSGLNMHLLVHTDKKPFKCDDCGQSFRQRGALNNHQKMHTNEPLSHQCEICNQKFRVRSHLKTHKEVKHSAIKQNPINVVEFE